MILDLDLTLKDEDLSPFWNEVSKEYHSLLWLPRKTVLQEVDTLSSKKSSNYRVEKSNSWKRKMTPKNSTQKHSLVLSRASLAPITEKEHHEEIVQITRKIRI